jgi:hypothetical protein
MGRSMILTDDPVPTGSRPEREANQPLIAAIANAYRWQEQLEAGVYAGLEDRVLPVSLHEWGLSVWYRRRSV